MALKSTIYKVMLNVADTNRQVYGDYALTIARHPSETDRRMMLRILAFALHADAALAFGRGISTDDEPDLWLKDDTGQVRLWVELGNPDPDRLRKACAKADDVVLYAYGDRATPVWWRKHEDYLSRFDNLQIYTVADAEAADLEKLAGQNLGLQCTVTDNTVWVSNDAGNVTVSLHTLKREA
ncbi:YaeQ family protein [Haliea sp. E17]|uniref:YaeQ family protein n=1 Tax=Haliea sp. E17 TaxID=3401576 RepID=UPI003AAE0534